MSTERQPSFELLEDEFMLEELYDGIDFDFDLSSVHSDAKNLLQSFIDREVISRVLKNQVNKVALLRKTASTSLVNKKDMVKRTLLERRKNLSSENLLSLLETKKKELEKMVQAPPFLRTSDKIAFTVGIIVLCVTEWILLTKQDLMPYWYCLMLFPLMIARYYAYSKAKFTYFMLDFCYFVQILLLIHLFIIPTNIIFFHMVFAASNGPLLVGLVMWRNSLVFHDLDKLTSVFIHLFPALVTYCIRWYPSNDYLSSSCPDGDCSLSYYTVFVLTMGFYVFWQILYLIQTDVVDRKKIDQDKNIMTSCRWMTEVKPHPIWKFYKKHGASLKYANFYLVVTQFFYTIGTLVPVMIVFNSLELHCIYLAIIVICSIWNGANFYFEIFTETYSKRLQRYLKKTITQATEDEVSQIVSSPPVDQKAT